MGERIGAENLYLDPEKSRLHIVQGENTRDAQRQASVRVAIVAWPGSGQLVSPSWEAERYDIYR